MRGHSVSGGPAAFRNRDQGLKTVARLALHTGVNNGEVRLRMNWFERHLNWTLAVTLLVAYAAMAVWVGSFKMGGWRAVLVACLMPLLPCGWVIRKKSQSLGWLAVVCATSAVCGYVSLRFVGHHYFYGWIPFTRVIPFIVGAVPLALANRSGIVAAESSRRSTTSARGLSNRNPALDIGGVPLGLVLLGGAIGLLVYMSTREMSAEVVGSAVTLCLAAALVSLPERVYEARPVLCFVARLIAVILVIAGLTGVLFGGAMVIGESYDPGHGIGMIGGCLLTGATVLFLSSAVLLLKARNGLNSAGEW